MLVSTAHSSSFSRFNTHSSYSLKQPNLIFKDLAFSQFKTFWVKKLNPNSDRSASNDILVRIILGKDESLHRIEKMPTQSNSSKLQFGDIVLRREVKKRAASEVSHKSRNGIIMCKTKTDQFGDAKYVV
ncbi:hypothetical protein GQ457_13G009690 [Hibiscus cannabinus]